MAIFPTQYSTLSSAALKSYIEKTYGYGPLTGRLLIRNVSDTYLFETPTTKYIFKIYRDAHRKPEEIKAEVELLTILHAGGAKVSFPITDLEGNKIQSFNAIEGTRYGVLFSFAPGKVIYSLSDEQLGLLGKEMAFIHTISFAIELPYKRKEYTIDTTIRQPLERIKPAFDELEEEYNYLKDIAPEIINKLGQFRLDTFSYGYCHYDFLPKNFHFAENGSITFFDFDFAGKGYLANDIASFYIHYFLEVLNKKITQEEADRAFNVFIESYRTIRALHDDEIKAIPYLGFSFWVFYLGFQYENFDDWSSIFFGPKFLKDRVALIKKWVEWYCKL